MKVELGIGKDATVAREALVLPAGGSLEDYAEFARRYLDCHAVVIRLVDPVGSAGSDEPPAKAPTARVCTAFDREGSGAAVPRLADRGKLADPVAAGKMGFGFYAGLPLRLQSGVNLGILAAVDHAPRDLSNDELATLKLLASVIVQTIEGPVAASGKQTGRRARG